MFELSFIIEESLHDYFFRMTSKFVFIDNVWTFFYKGISTSCMIISIDNIQFLKLDMDENDNIDNVWL